MVGKLVWLTLLFSSSILFASQVQEARVSTFLNALTLDEKLTLLAGDEYRTRSIRRLSIPSINMTDGPLGVVLNKNATAFPAGVALGASWNPALMRDVAIAIGEQARSSGHHMVLGPCVNIHRQPFGGRNFESYSEDTFLTTQFSRTFVQGLQDVGIMGSVKHFALNNQEAGRLSVDVIVDERSMHEVYFPAFKAAVDAGVWSVMAAYNKINGQYASENSYLLKDVLKGQWGFKGFVVSDWGATHSSLEAARNGLDLEMPQPRYFSPGLLKSEIEFGLISMADIDDKVSRILRAITFNNVTSTPVRGVSARAEHHKVALEAARESVVLLKNQSDLLPMKEPRQILVMGPFAEDMPLGGAGSSKITLRNKVSPLQELRNRLPKVNVQFVDSQTMLESDLEMKVRSADYVLFFGGFDGQTEGETKDRKELKLPLGQNDLLVKMTAWSPRVVVMMNSGGPVIVEDWIEKAGGLMHAWYLGEAGATALVDVLLGSQNPSGKLPVTFFKRWEDHSAYGAYPGDGTRVHYKEGIFVGYKFFDRYFKEPRFEFGYGLSYSTFKIEDVRLVSPLVVRGSIKNLSSVDGAEVVQVYVGGARSLHPKPVRELKGFKKIFVKAGQTETFEIEIDKNDLQTYDVGSHSWKLDHGLYTIYVGTSSRKFISSIPVLL